MSPGVLVAEIGGLARSRLLHGSVLPQGLEPSPRSSAQLVETRLAARKTRSDLLAAIFNPD
jgi:hypothetical protein